MEIWKDVPGYIGIYQASTLGRIRSLSRKVKSKLGSFRTINGKILKPANFLGYGQLVFSKDGKGVNVLVHRIIGLTFIPNPDNKLEINHKNGIRGDSRVENLEWATRSENEIHSHKILGKVYASGLKSGQYKHGRYCLDKYRPIAK